MTPINIALLLVALALGLLIAAIVINSRAQGFLKEALDSIPNDNNLPTFRIDEYEGWYAVVAVHPTTNGECVLTLKEFMRGIDDPEESAFALREALYLLDTLNER